MEKQQMIPNQFAKAGEVVFREGDAPTGGLYYICFGQVQLSRNEYGQERPLATLGEGEVFGEMGLVTAAPRNATVVATEDCGFFTLNEQNFQHRVTQIDPVLRGVFDVFVLTIRDMLVQRDSMAAQMAKMAQQLQTSQPEEPPAAALPLETAPEAATGLASGVARKLSY